MGEYYKKHREQWRKGGKYYYYKPVEYTYELTVKKGCFVLEFN